MLRELIKCSQVHSSFFENHYMLISVLCFIVVYKSFLATGTSLSKMSTIPFLFEIIHILIGSQDLIIDVDEF